MKKHEPTDESKKLVLDLYGEGYTMQSISEELEISRDTLRKYYKEILEQSHVGRVALVSEALYEKALGGDINAIKFWLERRGGEAWQKPSQKVPTPTDFTIDINPTNDLFDSPKTNRTHDGRMLDDDEYRQYLFDMTRQ